MNRDSCLLSPVRLGRLKLKNRVCVPPMVTYARNNQDGYAEDADTMHYEALARGGQSLVIVEAAAVEKRGRRFRNQLGIWEDAFVPGLARIADAIHRGGAAAILQLHHAGLLSCEEDALSASAYACTFRERTWQARAATIRELQQITRAFADAAKRAAQAGFDGIEIHGCHNYLLSQFYNRRVNRRTDRYGEETRLASDILRRCRAEASPGFLVGLRIGGFEPAIEDGARHAVCAERDGADYLHVSFGFAIDDSREIPKDWPFSDTVYAAERICREVTLPVLAVGGIRSPETAAEVLQKTGAALVGIGRGTLINPSWTADAEAGRDPGRCFSCTRCYFRGQRAQCPGRKEYFGRQQNEEQGRCLINEVKKSMD